MQQLNVGKISRCCYIEKSLNAVLFLCFVFCFVLFFLIFESILWSPAETAFKRWWVVDQCVLDSHVITLICKKMLRDESSRRSQRTFVIGKKNSEHYYKMLNDQNTWGISAARTDQQQCVLSIGHIPVHLSLHFRARLSAKSLLWNQFSFILKLELIIITKVSHLDSLWKRLRGTRKWPLCDRISK